MQRQTKLSWRLALAPLLVAVVVGFAAGCVASADPPASDHSAATTEQAFTPTTPAPNCNDPSTPSTVVQAIPHLGCSGPPGAGCYWAPFPTQFDPCPQCATYENTLRGSVFQANGYEYLVRILSTTQRNKEYLPWGHLFLGVGIKYDGANPPSDAVPPLSPRFPTFNPQQVFSATFHDWQMEVTLATNPATWDQPFGNNPPVDSDWFSCVKVLDQSFQPIDFFVLMDEHDPEGPPW
jgi:hypothetical protein